VDLIQKPARSSGCFILGRTCGMSTSLLAQEVGRALAEFWIIRQSMERISPQKIRSDRVFLEAG
jgi:hypothetical protein